ncbi:MAG: serine/threonine-protein kinase PknK [Myxococcota bacterium]
MGGTQSHASETFTGTERFRLMERLGAGAFGTVYKAFDAATNQVVALKRLHVRDPRALVRFKDEFRSLADVSHRHLAALYELHGSGDDWFLTMEYVDGQPLDAWLLGAEEAPPDEHLPRTDAAAQDPDVLAQATTVLAPDETRAHGPAPSSWPTDDPMLLSTRPAPLSGRRAQRDEAAVREALRQLAGAIRSLHEGGRLHRDIKPSNVLVERDGRVVVLDFGLVTPLHQAAGEDGTVAGTPRYMAPEVCAGAAPTEASDWYSFGVILYQALTGRSPFAGEPSQVVRAKQVLPALPPRHVAGDVPSDLEDLCVRLLERDPDRRPGGASLVRALGGERHAGAPSSGNSRRHAHRRRPFVGRSEELRRLEEALDSASLGTQEIVLVSGLSGVGKSALLERFVAASDTERNTVILRGCCYERGSVPYCALDGVVDGLAGLVARAGRRQAAEWTPPDMGELARLFPVLDQRGERASDLDVREAQRRGLRALRELLERVGRSRLPVLILDDLQWGDEDSVAMLAEILRPPDPPPLLLVGAYRSDEAEHSPFLRALLGKGGPVERAEHVTQIDLDVLDPDGARQLASLLVDDPDGAARVAEESGGHPLLIDELAFHLMRERDAPLPPAGLDAMIAERVEHLPRDARRFLECAAVAAEPVPDRLVQEAARLGGLDLKMMNLLRHGRLLRTRPVRGTLAVEPYHDRIREAVVAGLSRDERAERHLALADAAMLTGRHDAEFLAVHLHLGGEPARAAREARRAGDRAADTLAFDRAARFYSLALEAGDPDDGALRLLVADALRNAGRGPDAARAYLHAADVLDEPEARRLRVLAAEQLLFAGAYDAGESVVRKVLGGVGVDVSGSGLTAFASFGWQSLLLRLRGLEHRTGAASARDPEEMERIDILWSGTIGLSMANPVASQAVQKRHLRCALDAGEPRRLARALAVELAFSGIGGGRDERRSEELSRRAHAAAREVDHPYPEALTVMSDGAVHWLRGRWRRTLECAEDALDTFRSRCTGVTWEMDTAGFLSLNALLHMGRLRDLRERLDDMLGDAVERGDLYLETQLRTRFESLRHLMDDQPEVGARALAEAIGRWTPEGYHIVHFWALNGEVQALLHAGRGQDANARLDAGEGALKRSMLLAGGQYYRALYLDLRGRVDLAAACEDGGRRRRLIRRATRRARALRREDMPWIAPHADLLDAGVATAQRRSARAARLLERAIAGFEEGDMALHASVARRRLAQVRGDALGAEEADEAMRAETIARPEHMARVVAPGPWPRP